MAHAQNLPDDAEQKDVLLVIRPMQISNQTSRINRNEARMEAPWAPPRWAEPRSLALDRSATAVDGDDRPGNIARARRGEECHDLGDLLDVRGTLEQGRGP
jgi:hypothetical protein